MYQKKTWKARTSEFPTRRALTDVSTGAVQTVNVARDEGTVSEQGDGFSAANMNDLESRIAAGLDEKQGKITANGVLQGDGEGNITEANPQNLAANGYAPLLLCRTNDVIANSSDLNTEEFLHCGSYLCQSDNKAQSLMNCPVTKAFIMHVYCPTSVSDTFGAWTFRVRKIIAMGGDEFIQSVYCGATAGIYTWSTWKQINTNIPQALTATLTVAGWSNKAQTVSVAGVTANSIVTVTYAPASHDAWLDAGVYCSAQGAGTLTFTCESVPSAALTANIVIIA